MDTIKRGSPYKQVKNMLTTYVEKVDNFFKWSEKNKDQIPLFREIEKILKRRANGDLKDLSDADFPTYSEIRNTLNTLKFDELSWKFKEIEIWANTVVVGIRQQSFLEAFYKLPEHQQLLEKEEMARYLFVSKRGKEYLHEVMTNPSVPNAFPPIFDLSVLSSDLTKFKQVSSAKPPEFWIGNALTLTKLFHILLPEYSKYPDLERQKLAFITGKYVSVFRDFVETDGVFLDGNFPDTYSAFVTKYGNDIDTVEAAIQQELEVDTNNIELKNGLRQDLELWLPHFKLAFSMFQFGSKLKAMRETPSLRNNTEFLASLTDLIAESLEYFATIKKLPAEHVAFKVGKFAGKVSTFVFSPIIMCMDLHNLMEAISDGDTRGAWQAGISVVSAVTGIVLALLGAALIVALAVGIVFALGGFLLSIFVDSRLKTDLLTVLGASYFGKQYLPTRPNNINANPLDLRFEWNQQDKGETFRRQTRSIFSVMNRATIKEDSDLEPSYLQTILTVDKPPLRPVDYYVKIRFFREAPLGREETEPSIIIPLAFYNSQALKNSNWASTRPWFEDHHLELDLVGDHPQEFRGIKKYTVSMRLSGAAILTHRRVQMQFIPLPKGYDLFVDITTERMQRLETNTQIYIYSEAIRL